MIEAIMGTTRDNSIMALVIIGGTEKKYYYHKNFENEFLARQLVTKLYEQGGIPHDELNSYKWIESDINKHMGSKV